MLHQKEPGSALPMEFKFNSAEKPIRFEIFNQVPWAVAKDVCMALDIANNRDAISKLDDDELMVSVIPTPSRGKQKMTFVNESGIYSLIFRSNKPEARMFRKWVTNEVLPQIRRNGHYSPSAAPSGVSEPTDPHLNHDALCRLIYQAADIAGNQQMLASYLSVSPGVLTDLRNRPGKASMKLKRHVIHGCSKVVKLGAVPVEEIREINTMEVMRMWFDIVKIENYELRTSLSHRIARILGREEEFADDLAIAREKGGLNVAV